MAGTIKTQRNTMTVANGTAVSNGIQTRNRTACAIETPATLTNTTILFEDSWDGVTWQPLMNKDGTAQYSVPCATNQARTIPLDLMVMQAAEWVRIAFSGNEGGARTFQLRTRIVD